MERRLPLSPDYIIATEDAFASTMERNDQVGCVLSQPGRPTAFFCAGYYSALETLQVLREMGLRVPEDVSLIAFDDPMSARHITPPLTTVRQPLEAMGRVALERLLTWMTTGEPPSRHEVLETELVVRGSTAPCADPEAARP
jgi:LacI family transcriptional regulator